MCATYGHRGGQATPSFKTLKRFDLEEFHGIVDLGHNSAKSVGRGSLAAQPRCLPKKTGHNCAVG